MIIVFLVARYFVLDTATQVSRQHDIEDILKDFEGEFLVCRVEGKFDGIRISGSILNDAEFTRLVDRIGTESLSFNVDLNLVTRSRTLYQCVFKKEP